MTMPTIWKDAFDSQNKCKEVLIQQFFGYQQVITLSGSMIAGGEH